MFDLTFQLIFFRLAGLLVIAAVHGATVAGTARLLGDPGPGYDGRATLNPLPHLDLVGGLGVVVFALGWIRPTAIDVTRLRSGRIGLVVAAAAGLLACLLLAVFLGLARRPILGLSSGNLTLSGIAFLDVAAGLCLWFAVINVIPLPPLTGGLFLHAAFPKAAALAERYRFVAIAVLAVFVVSGLAERLLAPLHDALSAALIAG